ncbi:MAG: RNA polymerase sigma factor [Oligosphaeraceae bacterium]
MKRRFPHLPSDAVDDVHQMVMLDLFSKGGLEHYDRERGRFRTYLSKIIHNKCCDLNEKYTKEKEKREKWSVHPAVGQAGEVQSQLQLQEEKEWQEFLEIKALELLRQEVSEQQYMIFELYVRQNLPVKEVSQILKVSENQVYLAKSRLGDKLAAILRQLRKESD